MGVGVGGDGYLTKQNLAGGVSFDMHSQPPFVVLWKFTVWPRLFSRTVLPAPVPKKKQKRDAALGWWDYTGGGLVGHMTPFESSQKRCHQATSWMSASEGGGRQGAVTHAHAWAHTPTLRLFSQQAQQVF